MGDRKQLDSSPLPQSSDAPADYRPTDPGNRQQATADSDRRGSESRVLALTAGPSRRPVFMISNELLLAIVSSPTRRPTRLGLVDHEDERLLRAQRQDQEELHSQSEPMR